MRNVLLIAILMMPTLALAAETPATTKPTTAAAIIDVTEKDKIKAAVGQELTVRGKVSQVFTSRSGRVLLNFEGIGRQDFNVMIQKANVDAITAGLGGDMDKALKEMIITVTGPVTLYRENPQIEVTKPEQIKVLGEDEDKNQEKKEEKKE